MTMAAISGVRARKPKKATPPARSEILWKPHISQMRLRACFASRSEKRQGERDSATVAVAGPDGISTPTVSGGTSVTGENPLRFLHLERGFGDLGTECPQWVESSHHGPTHRP